MLAPEPPEEMKLTRSASPTGADQPPNDPPSEASVVLLARLTAGSSKSPLGTEATAVQVIRTAGRSVLSLMKVAKERENVSHEPNATVPRLEGELKLPCQRVPPEPEVTTGSICSQYLIPARRVTVEAGTNVLTEGEVAIDGLVTTTARTFPGRSDGLPLSANEALFSRIDIFTLTAPKFCESAMATLSTVTSDCGGTVKATAESSPDADASEDENPMNEAPSDPVPNGCESKAFVLPSVSSGRTLAALTVTRIRPADCKPKTSRIV